MRHIYLILFMAFFFSCQQTQTPNMASDKDGSSNPETPIKKTYLALGDSYTIGESVDEHERWPVLLQKALDDSLQTPKIIAKTGWTTGELNEAIDNEGISETYDIVSLLIGVNNQYRGEARGFTTESYRKEFTDLLDRAIGFAGDDKDKVFVVSIPDYSVVPFAKDSDTTKIRTELEEYNAIGREISESKDVLFLDITPISQEAKSEASLVAPDGLHPSGAMYKRWVDEVILEEVKAMLE